MKKSAVNFKSVYYPTKEEYAQKPISNSKIAFKLTSASLAALALVASLGGCKPKYERSFTDGDLAVPNATEKDMINLIKDKSKDMGLSLEPSQNQITLNGSNEHTSAKLNLDLKAKKSPIYFSYISDEDYSISHIDFESNKNNMTYIYGDISDPIYAVENNESKDIYCIINRTAKISESHTIKALEDFINWYSEEIK